MEVQKGQETVNRRVGNFPFGVVRDTLDWDKVYEWSGLKPEADWVQEAFWLSGGRVSEDAQGFTAPFVFFASFSAVRAVLSVSYRSL